MHKPMQLLKIWTQSVRSIDEASAHLVNVFEYSHWFPEVEYLPHTFEETPLDHSFEPLWYTVWTSALMRGYYIRNGAFFVSFLLRRCNGACVLLIANSDEVYNHTQWLHHGNQRTLWKAVIKWELHDEKESFGTYCIRHPWNRGKNLTIEALEVSVEWSSEVQMVLVWIRTFSSPTPVGVLIGGLIDARGRSPSAQLPTTHARTGRIHKSCAWRFCKSVPIPQSDIWARTDSASWLPNAITLPRVTQPWPYRRLSPKRWLSSSSWWRSGQATRGPVTTRLASSRPRRSPSPEKQAKHPSD